MGKGLAVAEEAAVAPSTMDATFQEQLKDGAEAFEFQAEVRMCISVAGGGHGGRAPTLPACCLVLAVRGRGCDDRLRCWCCDGLC